VLSPNDRPIGDPSASRSTSHGGFDDDEATLKALFARITGGAAETPREAAAPLVLHASAPLLRSRRVSIEMNADTRGAVGATNDGGRIGR
jgi:hypothetical protein